MNRLTAVAMLTASLCGTALAQMPDEDRRKLFRETPDEIRPLFSRGSRLNVEAAALQMFSQSSGGREGVSSESLDAASRAVLSRLRSSAVAEVAKFDADADGVATAEEVAQGASDAFQAQVRQGLPEDRRAQAIAQATAQVLRMDADKDGRVTLKEAYAFAQQQAASDRSTAALAKLLELRPKGATSLSRQDFMAYVARRFAAFDLDSDGVISGSEMASLANAPQPFAGGPRGHGVPGAHGGPALCDAPKPSQSAKVALVMGYEGVAMSTAYVGTPDLETQVADVVIEPGEGPVYVFASSYRQIVWRVRGAVDRVERFVATVSHGGIGVVPSGVVGLQPDKVSFATPGACFKGGSGGGSVEGLMAKAELAKSFGRPPDVVAGGYGMGSLSLPSGNASPKAEGAFAPEYLTRAPIGMGRVYVERGMVEVDPRSVVSKAKVGAYDVMPQGFGLAKLIADGAIVPMDNSRDFKVVAPIPRFPAGLNGGHLVRFVIARGVPLPAGDPGHSCVVMEETGEANRMCR